MVATMMINNELNGIEIKFDCKPMACTSRRDAGDTDCHTSLRTGSQ